MSLKKSKYWISEMIFGKVTIPGSMPFLIKMGDDIEQEWKQTEVKKLILKPTAT
jgi:hypothetical protein